MQSSRHWAAVVLSCAAFASSAAIAEDEPPAWRRSVYLGLAAMRPQADPLLTEQDGHLSVLAGYSWRFSRHLAIDLAALDTGQHANMPRVERSGSAPSGSRADAHINTTGLALGVKVIYPLGKLEPYAGAGVGYYASQISSWGTLVHLFLPSDLAKRKDSDLGTHFMAGFDYRLSPVSALSLEYRQLRLEAAFGPEFGGRVKIGGGMVVLAYRIMPR